MTINLNTDPLLLALLLATCVIDAGIQNVRKSESETSFVLLNVCCSALLYTNLCTKQKHFSFAHYKLFYCTCSSDFAYSSLSPHLFSKDERSFLGKESMWVSSRPLPLLHLCFLFLFPISLSLLLRSACRHIYPERKWIRLFYTVCAEMYGWCRVYNVLLLIIFSSLL